MVPGPLGLPARAGGWTTCSLHACGRARGRKLLKGRTKLPGRQMGLKRSPGWGGSGAAPVRSSSSQKITSLHSGARAMCERDELAWPVTDEHPLCHISMASFTTHCAGAQPRSSPSACGGGGGGRGEEQPAPQGLSPGTCHPCHL